MPSLKFHPATPRHELDPIPFPVRGRVQNFELGLAGRRHGDDSIRNAEQALDRVENDFADLLSLLSENEGDRPRAA